MKRSKHSLSHYKLLTLDMAELVPVGVYEVLPGDSIQQASSALIRVSPLLAPVMHPVSVRIHHWFVPYRLLWTQWEDFITGGSDGLGDGAVYPTITVNNAPVGSLEDYFGIPPSVAQNRAVSALPFRAYAMIFNEFYRDQDLTTELALVKTGGADATTARTLAKVAWEKDYFTAARPWAQKGPEVTLPLGIKARVATDAAEATDIGIYSTAGTPGFKKMTASTAAVTQAASAEAEADSMYADLTTATAASVNDIREAFALQRYQEARAMYGSRYTEYLRYLGVRSSDARLQRPEYLGGGKQTISFTEILQTGVNFDANTGVGQLKGHGISAMRSRRFRRFFEEHGVVLSLLSVRPRAMYSTGIHRMWNRTTKEDFWQRELQDIGQQEILNKEVYSADSGPEDVFGFGDRYSEYRHHPSGISAEFRTTLNFWHLARIFGADVTLNNSFVECDPSKRIHAVQSADTLWVMVNHSIQARRQVKRPSIGRIL